MKKFLILVHTNVIMKQISIDILKQNKAALIVTSNRMNNRQLKLS